MWQVAIRVGNRVKYLTLFNMIPARPEGLRMDFVMVMANIQGPWISELDQIVNMD